MNLKEFVCNVIMALAIVKEYMQTRQKNRKRTVKGR